MGERERETEIKEGGGGERGGVMMDTELDE